MLIKTYVYRGEEGADIGDYSFAKGQIVVCAQMMWDIERRKEPSEPEIRMNWENMFSEESAVINGQKRVKKGVTVVFRDIAV